MKEHHHHLSQVSPKVDRFFERTFDKLEIAKPDNLEESLQGCRVMIASTHRSHVDYFLLGNLLHHLGVDNIRFAAGDNLMNFPYLGKRFRNWGAYAVERDRANSRNYLVDLCMKTASMLEEKDSILVFPEMGRSYKGSMLEMKQVILTAAILVQARRPQEKVVYLPAAISYERLPELSWFDILLTGKKWRKPENSTAKRLIGSVLYFGADLVAIGKFYHSWRFGKAYGSTYVDFGKPVPVPQIVDFTADYNSSAPGEFWAYRAGAKKVSAFLFEQLQSLYRVLPGHVLGKALATGAKTRSDAERHAAQIMDSLRTGNRNIRTLQGHSPEQIVTAGTRQLAYDKAIALSGDRFVVKRSTIVDYYAAALG